MNLLNQAPPKTSDYRAEIDGLRALAVSSVVVFHFFPDILSQGYLGVDIFFVISGFLITTHLLSLENKNPIIFLKSFYSKRIKRLFPALFLFLALTYIFISRLFLSVDTNKFEESLVASYTFWANFYFWRDGGYFGGNDQLKPLLHMWSLSIEEQFYLFFPFLLILLVKLGKSINYSLELGLSLVTLISLSLWLFLNYIGGENPSFFLMPTRVWQFGLGALLAVKTCKGIVLSSNSGIMRLKFMISVIMIVLSLIIDFNAQAQTFIITIGALGFIAFSGYENTFITSLFRNKTSVFFGKISYSLYLYHWPIAVALTYYFVNGVPALYSFVGILLSVLLGYASWMLVESNFRYKFDFKLTLYFITLCLCANVLNYLTISKKETHGLANTISKASGTHFRCDISSYIPYGASRACSITKRESSNKTVALIGNSHALMYAPLVSDVVPEEFDLLLVQLNGCLPTVTINISRKCLEMAKTNLSAVLRDESISVVIIATTWYEDYYVNTNGNRVDRSSLVTALSMLVDEIRHSGKYAVLFSPIAIPKRDYASELARQLRFNQLEEYEVLDTLKIPRSLFDDQFASMNSYFEKSLDGAYLKVYEDLCDTEYCFFGDKDLFYFADNNHLSQHAFIAFNRTKEQLKFLLVNSK